MRSFNSIEEAYDFLKEIKAPDRLIRHAKLVSEAGEILIGKLKELNLQIDEHLVRMGIIFHDIGKATYIEELDYPGNKHEKSGQQLLLEYKVDPRIARCCLSHAQWNGMECSLEELLVALADKLWKGVRNEQLETAIIERITMLLNGEKWNLFIELDSTFELIAANGMERLRRS